VLEHVVGGCEQRGGDCEDGLVGAQPTLASQSASSPSSRVLVPNARTSCTTWPSTTSLVHALTERGCTSSPAQRAYIRSIAASDGGGSVESLVLSKSLVRLRVQLADGLAAPMQCRPRCHHRLYARFMQTWVAPTMGS
jgi:hypothetical protein